MCLPEWDGIWPNWFASPLVLIPLVPRTSEANTCVRQTDGESDWRLFDTPTHQMQDEMSFFCFFKTKSSPYVYFIWSNFPVFPRRYFAPERCERALCKCKALLRAWRQTDDLHSGTASPSCSPHKGCTAWALPWSCGWESRAVIHWKAHKLLL